MRSPRILALFGNVPLLGQERANIETLHALHEQGCAVLFLIRAEYTEATIQAELRRRGLRFEFVPFYDTLRHGVPIRVWIRNFVNIVRGSWRLWRIARRFRATHLHAGSTANVFNFLPALALIRLPLVFRAGDLPPLHHALWRLTWRFVAWRAASIVCDSRFLQQQLVAWGAPQERTSVIYAPAPRRERTNKPGAAAQRGTILYIGQISEAKGVHLLVNAAVHICKRDPTVRFVVAGDFSWNNSFAVSQIKRVHDAGLQGSVTFPGFVEDIDELYRGAIVHVAPSLVAEGYGLTVIEAKSRGVPSIVFPSGALPELVTHGEDGLVCAACTAVDLEAAIRQYLDAPDLRARHGIAARESLARMRVSDFATEWMAAYRRASTSINHVSASSL